MEKELTDLNSSLREAETINDIKESIMIADFVGTRLKKSDKDTQQWCFDFCNGYYPTQSHFKFKTSWDWLMPVVNKIAEYRLAYPKETSWVCDCKIVVYQHALYREVVNFIKWYNSHSPNKQ